LEYNAVLPIIHLTHKVTDQTTGRVIHGESVPASEKIVSIFEPQTDIIVKDRRDTFYGHKICLTDEFLKGNGAYLYSAASAIATVRILLSDLVLEGY